MRSIDELSNLSGRTALITGGAGHIGRAMAEALVENDCKVILADRSQNGLEEAKGTFATEQLGQVEIFCGNLEDEDARQELVASIAGNHGALDILINNAAFVGDSQLDGWAVPFESQSIETWRRALEVNLTAPFQLARDLAPALRQSGHGTIINVGSIYGVLGPVMDLYAGTGMGNPGAYAASKGGLLQLTRWLATTLAPDVRVNSISPGGIERSQDSAFKERYLQRTPLGRMGVEEDFKGVTLFLASDLSAWVTGQNIMVDGGWSAW